MGNPKDGSAVESLLAAAMARLVSPQELGVISEVTDPFEILEDIEGRRSLIVIDRVEMAEEQEDISILDWNRRSLLEPREESEEAQPQTGAVGEKFREVLRISSTLVPIPRVLLLGIPTPLTRWQDRTCFGLVQTFPFLLFQCLKVLNREFGISIAGWAGCTPPVDSWELVIDPPREIYPR